MLTCLSCGFEIRQMERKRTERRFCDWKCEEMYKERLEAAVGDAGDDEYPMWEYGVEYF